MQHQIPIAKRTWTPTEIRIDSTFTTVPKLPKDGDTQTPAIVPTKQTFMQLLGADSNFRTRAILKMEV